MIDIIPWGIIVLLVIGVFALAAAGSDNSERTIPEPRPEDVEE